MKSFIEKYNLWYRFQQLVILVLHLILLKWMYFILTNSGALTTAEVFYHFIGIAVTGALLIKGCSYWARHHYLKEVRAKKEDEVLR